MKNKKELNIFLENAYENFEPQIDMRQLTDDTKKMMAFFLDNDGWVKKSCLDGEDFETISFDIVFCNNEKIHEINREYRDKDRPTDVISFAIFADSEPEERFIFDGEINLGEIIISLDKTKEQADENGHGLYDELYFLLAHGILHLAGYDHQTEETLAEMWNMQKEMTGVINV